MKMWPGNELFKLSTQDHRSQLVLNNRARRARTEFERLLHITLCILMNCAHNLINATCSLSFHLPDGDKRSWETNLLAFLYNSSAYGEPSCQMVIQAVSSWTSVRASASCALAGSYCHISLLPSMGGEALLVQAVVSVGGCRTRSRCFVQKHPPPLRSPLALGGGEETDRAVKAPGS